MATTDAAVGGSRIFISYRREDSDIWVGRLADELRKRFPPEQIFQDIASIDPGADFRTVLNEALSTAAAVLVVVGPRWLSATDKQGRKRLDNPADLVRQEIAESLRRPGVRVFPLLVNGAEMPAEEDVPEPLKALCHRQSFDLTVRHWANDVAQLVQTLKRVPGLSDADIREAAEAAVRVRAQQEAQHREAEERTAKEEAQRVAAAGEAGRTADEAKRHTATEDARRRVEVEARRAGAEQQAKRSADEDARRKEEARRGSEEEARRGTAEEEAPPRGVEPSQAQAFLRKALTGIVAMIGIAAWVAVYFWGEKRPESAPSTPSAQAEKPSAAPTQTAPPPPAVETQAQPPRAKEFRDCDQCPEMVMVPSGRFMMGSPVSAGVSDATPLHDVAFARSFAVGKYEVTFDEWDACVEAGGCKSRPEDRGWGRGKRPVIDVNWANARAYVAWLSQKTGHQYRLLSEAEWEYAARGGTTTRYPWGDDPGVNRANFNGSGSKWSGKQTAPVGSFEASAFGLHDMIGNVGEWVQDCWNDTYTGAPTDGRAWDAGNCGRRVVRGGSWNDKNVHIAERAGYLDFFAYKHVGFRVARML
jgi:formylglycine-generating enzyme required for sulfatase activity